MVDRDTCPLRCFAPCAKGALLWDGWGTWLLRWLFPFAVSRLCREKRSTLGWAGTLLSRCSVPAAFLERFPRHKLPLAYLRESLLVLHLQLLFQGGVKFPTGGKSGGAKGVPWRSRGACGRADESATRVCVGSHAG